MIFSSEVVDELLMGASSVIQVAVLMWHMIILTDGGGFQYQKYLIQWVHEFFVALSA
jgi:queuine/archaeosine tRNA-ribosyltransferase